MYIPFTFSCVVQLIVLSLQITLHISQVLKERGVDDIAINNLDLNHSPNRYSLSSVYFRDMVTFLCQTWLSFTLNIIPTPCY
jgi:hypothetical protein